MPTIISSTKLRNEYNEVSNACHASEKPVFVTRNGAGDLAVMSIEAYEALARRSELAAALALGHADVEAGRTVPAHEAIEEIRKGIA